MAKSDGGKATPQPLDLPGFAQEFLRRNPRYRADHHTVMRLSTREGATQAREVMARKWGLSFPLCARRIRRHPSRALARHRSSLHGHPRPRT